jgi:hypothetical protein
MEAAAKAGHADEPSKEMHSSDWAATKAGEEKRRAAAVPLKIGRSRLGARP